MADAAEEDVVVETVDGSDFGPPGGAADSGPTENSTPDWFFGFFHSIVDVVQTNGWLFLVLIVVAWFAKQKLEAYLREKRKRDGDAAHAKDPDELLDLQLRREERIRRLQEQQDAASAVAAEKQREKEEQERKDRIQEYDDFLTGKGYKPKSRHNDSSASTETSDASAPPPQLPNRPRQRLRDNDYSPMMGGGGSGGYRPAPRGGGSGGG